MSEHFEAADRCDRCGARAAVKASKPANADLLFCGHHGAANRTALTDAGWTLTDDKALASV